MPQIDFYDETFGATAPRGEIGRALCPELFEISAANLIRLRVELEYERANAPRPKILTHEDLRLFSQEAKIPRLAEAIEAAQRGLEDNAYFLLVNGRQVRALDEIIGLDEVNSAVFLKLIPLKGG